MVESRLNLQQLTKFRSSSTSDKVCFWNRPLDSGKKNSKNWSTWVWMLHLH